MKPKIEGGKMPWGKFKDCYIHFVEEDYLEWVVKNCDWDPETLSLCMDELARRKAGRFGQMINSITGGAMTNYKENPNRKVFNIDFDGTLTDGQLISEPIPVQSIIDQVTWLYFTGHTIIIWTARQWNQAPFLVGWLTKYSVPFHGVIMAKGGSDHYIDDKMMSMDKFYNREF
jgi:uncharacterized protein (DUF3820 family)